MQIEEISEDIGIELQTESLLVRAEQLARLETDKLVDKVKDTIDKLFIKFFFSNDVYNISSCVFIFYFKSFYANSTVRVLQYLYSSYTTLPRIRRERSFHELPSPKDVSPSSKPVEENVPV